MVKKRTQYAVGVAMVAVVFGPVAVDSLFGPTAGSVAGFVTAGSVSVVFAVLGVAGAIVGGASLRLGVTLDESDSVIDIADGDRVYVEGVARPNEQTVTAPFTGEECLACTYAVQWEDTEVMHDETAPEGNERRSKATWRDVTTGRMTVPFELDAKGGSGTLLVRDEGLTPALDDDETTIVVGPDETPPERVETFLKDPSAVAPAGTSVGLPSFDRDRKLRYRETLLLPREEVFVMGEGARARDADLGSEAGVDAVVSSPTRSGWLGRIRDYIPEKVYPFGFIVADSPMDETVSGMRGGGAFMLVLTVIAFAIAWVGFTTALSELGQLL